MGRMTTTTRATTPAETLTLERPPSGDELDLAVARFVANFYPRS